MDLTTTYLGLRLPHPFMAGASPMSADLDVVRRLEDAECAAVVLPSLFEEQITLAETGTIRHMDPHDARFAPRLADYPPPGDYRFNPDAYVEHLRRLKSTLSIPVIASLNGTTAENWLKYAGLLQEAGADALEVNVYEVVTGLDVPGVAVESTIRDVVLALKQALRIPVAVKLSPFFSAVGNVARQLDQAGADGLVLFNRFYQPDIDIETMTVSPHLDLSRSDELLLRLRWMAILHGRLRASLALTGGIERPRDAIKALLAGADVVQMVSALLRHGPRYLTVIRDGLLHWMEWQKVSTVAEMRGRVSLGRVPDPSAFERAQYIRSLQIWGR